MDIPGTLKSTKRQALLVASPPEHSSKKSKSSPDDDKCVICEEAEVSQQNPLKQPNQETWNSIAKKAEEWKDLGTKYDNVYKIIKVNSVPKKIHKFCKLDISGQKLERAKKNKKKTIDRSDSGDDPENLVLKTNEPRLKSSRITAVDATCVFCTKPLEGKAVRNRLGERLSTKFHRLETLDAWNTFCKSVEFVKDELTKTRLESLITFCNNFGGILKAAALNIQYHKDCWKIYCRPIYNINSMENKKEQHQQRVQWVTQNQTVAFNKLCEFVVECLDENKEVYTLRDLLYEYEQIQRDLLISDTEIRNSCDDRHALRSLREKLITRFGDDIGFQTRYRRNESSIVFFKKHGGAYVESAVNSWGTQTSVIIRNVAKILHSKNRKMPSPHWPFNIEALKVDSTSNDIHNLIALLANPSAKLEEGRAVVPQRLQPAVRFISELITHLITGKRQPMQVSLSMSVHNLTGSKELINILKKLKIGISYDDVLDELAALAIQERRRQENFETGFLDLLCPQQIASFQPGTVVMDNDDFQEDGLTGSETSHYTNVIMAQQSSFSCESGADNLDLFIPTPEMKKNICCPIIPKDLSNKTRGEVQPKSFETTEGHSTVHRLIHHALIRHITIDQNLPSFTGFHCSLQSNVVKWDTYNVKSYSQPPSKEVVNNMLNWCQLVAEQKQMPLIQLVGDQAVYKYIEECLCQNPDKWPRVKGVLGGFHTEMSYLNALGKRLEGCGIEELAVESNVVAAGSVKQALSGKHYNRAMRLHKLISESLIRMLIQRCLENHPDMLGSLNLEELASTEEQVEEVVISDSFNNFVRVMFADILESESEMAKFWLSYIIDVEVLFQHYHCIRSGVSFDEYLDSCRKMLPLLAAYGNVNYLRYLSLYFWRMSTLTPTEKEHMASIYSFSLTGNNYSKLPPDQVIEMTMNKQSKNRRSGGWVGFTKNLSMIAISILSRPSVLYIKQQLQEAIYFKKPLYRHPELGPSRLKKDVEVINSVKIALEEWDADPWDLTKPILRSLCTGQPATIEVLNSLRTAHEDGNSMTETVLKRLSTGNASLHDPISKRKSKTFASKSVPNKPKQQLRTSVDHAATKQVVDLLTTGQNSTMTLEDLMEHRLTEISLPLFSADGMFHKPVKSKFISTLNLQPVLPPTQYHVIVDVGMAWNKVPACKTWRQFALDLYKFIINRHPQAVAFHLINDIYDERVIMESVKNYEQKRRMQSYGFVPNVYPVADQQMPTGKSWRSFLSKPENKRRLQEFLLKEWVKYDHIADWYYTMGLLCYNLTTGEYDPRFEAFSSSEADIRAFFQAAQLSDSYSVVFDFEDTDVWIIASYISHLTEQNMYMHKKKPSGSEFFNCRSFCSDSEKASAAVGVYTFTGCDSVEGFFGLGKVTTMKRILHSDNVSYYQTIQQLGSSDEFSEQLFLNLELLTIRVMYNDPVSKTLAHARARKWRQLQQFDTARLPPDIDSFKQHCLRSHLQAYEYKNARQIKRLVPANFGWRSEETGLRPVMYTVPALPSVVQTIFQRLSNEEAEEQEADGLKDSDIDGEVKEGEADEPIIVNDSASEDSDTDDE